jgi:hypothetical protein
MSGDNFRSETKHDEYYLEMELSSALFKMFIRSIKRTFALIVDENFQVCFHFFLQCVLKTLVQSGMELYVEVCVV